MLSLDAAAGMDGGVYKNQSYVPVYSALFPDVYIEIKALSLCTDEKDVLDISCLFDLAAILKASVANETKRIGSEYTDQQKRLRTYRLYCLACVGW